MDAENQDSISGASDACVVAKTEVNTSIPSVPADDDEPHFPGRFTEGVKHSPSSSPASNKLEMDKGCEPVSSEPKEMWMEDGELAMLRREIQEMKNVHERELAELKREIEEMKSMRKQELAELKREIVVGLRTQGDSNRTTPKIPEKRYRFPSLPEDTLEVNASNIVIFGETGAGKSSIVNLIANEELAHISNDAFGCTFQHRRYPIDVDGTQCTLWDTTGLEEGTEGRLPAAKAEEYLTKLIGALANGRGIHLLIYCIRGGRITKAHKRNYDLFYVEVCRKKVPIALVVTGLEHQEPNMDAWWTTNQEALGQIALRFSEHACVTTLRLKSENPIIQQRRSESQKILREIVVKYSKLPAWKADLSVLPMIMPAVRSFLRKATLADRARSVATRRVVVCGMEPANIFVPNTPLPDTTSPLRIEKEMGGQLYEFFYMDRHFLQHPKARDVDFSAGLLVFHTSRLENEVISLEEIHLLEAFYEMAGGHTCPLVVVLEGCNYEEQATQEFRDALASRQSRILAHFTTPLKLDEMVRDLCIDRVDLKAISTHGFWQWFPDSLGRLMHGKETGSVTP